MRYLWLILALATIVGLTAQPAAAAQSRDDNTIAEAIVSVSGADCECCATADNCATNGCVPKCFSASAIFINAPTLTHPPVNRYPMPGAIKVSALAPRPDPPPPRS